MLLQLHISERTGRGVPKITEVYGKGTYEFRENPKGILEITEMLGYSGRKPTKKYVKPLVEQGRLAMTIPDKPQSKNQKYVTVK